MIPQVTDREELIAVVQRGVDMQYAEAEMPQVLDLLVRSTACPHVSDLIYWPKRPMTAQEIVDTALAHRAIILGSGT